ncbi:hypothetical protein ACKKBF_B33950 [Auxenochlorella protothecoides x Auxenochlorella symbiontica]
MKVPAPVQGSQGENPSGDSSASYAMCPASDSVETSSALASAAPQSVLPRDPPTRYFLMLPTWPLPRGQQEITRQLLSEANQTICQLPLPDALHMAPVHEDCLMVCCARKFGIPAISVVLGASYFQRLLQNHIPMFQLAVSNDYFLPYPTEALGGKLELRERMFLRATKSVPTLLSVYVTCVYMALKVSDRVKHTGMLSAMLTDMLGRRVHSWQAVQLEVECLVGLTWRLGPYFSTTTARI